VRPGVLRHAVLPLQKSVDALRFNADSTRRKLASRRFHLVLKPIAERRFFADRLDPLSSRPQTSSSPQPMGSSSVRIKPRGAQVIPLTPAPVSAFVGGAQRGRLASVARCRMLLAGRRLAIRCWSESKVFARPIPGGSRQALSTKAGNGRRVWSGNYLAPRGLITEPRNSMGWGPAGSLGASLSGVRASAKESAFRDWFETR